MDDHTMEPTGQQFLLLFYWEGGRSALNEDEERERTAEFTAWARTLETRGELIAMETLVADDPGVRLSGANDSGSGSEGPPPPGLHLDRACVTRARDREAALEAARHAPHLRFGGVVVVQEIQRG